MLGTTTALLAGFCFLQRLCKAGEQRQTPGNKDRRRQAQRPPPGAPCPPCSRPGDLPHSPHRHLSTVCTEVRVSDAVSNLEKGSGFQTSLSTARREAAWLCELCLASILKLQQQMGEITTGLHLASNTSSCTQLQLFRKELCGNLPHHTQKQSTQKTPAQQQQAATDSLLAEAANS